MKRAAILLLCVCSLAYTKEPKKPGVHLTGILIGSTLLVGGSFLAIQNHRESDRLYRQYQRSAFTENTESLRKDSETKQTVAWLGTVLAGIGAVTVTFSF